MPKCNINIISRTLTVARSYTIGSSQNGLNSKQWFINITIIRDASFFPLIYLQVCKESSYNLVWLAIIGFMIPLQFKGFSQILYQSVLHSKSIPFLDRRGKLLKFSSCTSHAHRLLERNARTLRKTSCMLLYGVPVL